MVNWAPFLWGIKYNIWVFYRDNMHLPTRYSEMLQHLPTPAWSELSLLGINPQSSSFLHRTKPHCWRCSPSCHSCPAQQQSQEQQQERNSPRTATHTHTHSARPHHLPPASPLECNSTQWCSTWKILHSLGVGLAYLQELKQTSPLLLYIKPI